MLDFINTDDTELKEYNSKTKNAMQEMKSFCDGDDFIIDCRKKDHLKVVDPPKESEPTDSIDSIPTHDSNDEIVQNLATRMHASACISYEKLQQLVNSSDFQEIADQLDTKQAEEIMGYVGRLKSALM